MLVSGVVSTRREGMSGGAPLENFLDHHLDRQKGCVLTKPAFLDGSDLQLPKQPNDASDSYVGLLGRSNDTAGSSMPSSTGSETPDASLEQSCG